MSPKAHALLIFLCLTFSARAQDPWGKLFDAVLNKVGEAGTRRIEALDSIDFQMAISVNENAGFFDVEQKGETGAQIMYQQKEEQYKTSVDKARDTLEQGIGMFGIRRYEMAEKRFNSARKMLESGNLTNSLVYLRTMTIQGLIYLTQGRVQEADEFINWSLTRGEKMLGRSSAAVIANLNNLAKLHQTVGKYNEAEKEYNEAIELCKQVFGNGMVNAILFNNKAILLQSVGRYEEAFALMNQAITFSTGTPKKIEGRSFDKRKFLINLAFLYQLSGEYAKSEETFLSIKKVFDNRQKQTETPEYAGLLNQLGILYIQMGKMTNVEALLKGSMGIYLKRFKSEQNIFYAKVANDLGNFYRIVGRNAEAEVQLSKALTLRELLLGANHPSYIRSLEDMAILYWKTNRPDKAYLAYKQVMDTTINFINRYFPPMSEAEKGRYWDVTSPRFQRFYNFAIESHAKVPAVLEDFYNYQIATKGLLLNSTSRIREAILQSKDAKLIERYKQWLSKKEQLVKLYAYSKQKLKVQTIDLAKIEAEVNTLERLLSEGSAMFSSAYSTSKVTFRQITGLLTDNEVVVEIVRVRGFQQDFTPEARYAALVLKKGMSAPRLVVLENGKSLETTFIRFHKNMVRSHQDDTVSFPMFWAKIGAETEGKKVMYFASDGVFSEFNLNTLKNKEGEYLISKYDIFLLGNSRDLLKVKAAKPVIKISRAYLTGFPDYGTDKVKPLPGTQKEMESISKALASSGTQVTTMVQKDALEINMKKSAGYTLLHIATHGYFKADVETDDGSIFGIDAENAANNPLLRSGLFLANVGNAMDSQPPDMVNDENGVLTAYEAMNINLDGTSLVILSACETGLGEVRAGEGVYGLQRAFLVAGAETLIMSLWKVDDEATQLLMTSFYTNWIKTGNKQKAFKEAQLELMAKYAEPYFWGAFVMMGV